ncbi:prenyltransferase [Marinicella sediminis]|uniref:Prenyltransferase n=1 Tax=Marinicella sediminis TaxID=1792834 RepID=A0ABV7J3L6_9GAMM|nr:prenyltransferase [Marinicella sediminis]
MLMTVIKTMRPPFLILSPVCVFLGYSMALKGGANSQTGLLLLVMSAALCAHISVNMLNEYSDFKTGLDFNTHQTPFSGGSGALPAEATSAPVVLALGLFFLAVSVVIGLYLMSFTGQALLPLGLLGVVLVLSYTPWLNRWPLICLLAPGLGFGAVMTVGTYVILTGVLAWQIWVVAAVVFCLINNLLLLNQVPDINADRQAGRCTFPIAYGLVASHVVYVLFAMLAVVLLMMMVFIEALPRTSMWALVPMLGAIVAVKGAVQWQHSIGQRPALLAANVVAAVLTPLVLALTLLLD